MPSIPMTANVLMLGVDPKNFDRYQRMLKDTLHGSNTGWIYVANRASSFDHAIELLAKNPEIDVIYICNEVGLTDSALRYGAVRLATALAQHPNKPCVVLGENMYHLRVTFQMESVDAETATVAGSLHDRHEAKREAAFLLV